MVLLTDYHATATRAKEDSILKAVSAAGHPSFLGGVLSQDNSIKKSAKHADSIRLALQYSDKKVMP
jgi:hypothetical protein